MVSTQFKFYKYVCLKIDEKREATVFQVIFR